MKLVQLVTALAVAAAVPSGAQTVDAPKPKPQRDPNRMICERIEELGSRLAARKVCMTAAQWAEQRRQDRDVVDRLQQSHCSGTGGEVC
ncbi:hypothetical protein HMF7854_02990 [Sphingomonas ginkgonis]|uniref:Secreted protein n=1 Tax=Sphingomonas ginkgonis TaxID=2315330 RepID=A0A429V7H7_9SPHN|nr:hypothetical protein [Sphingomonas ginkgonis]RST29903.1 hypothetical protein HMF7854_02990 [Sphingomonas ginkgonis]